MFPAIVINLDEIDRFVTDPFSYLIWKILIIVLPLAIVFIWGFAQLWLDSRQGKFAAKQKYVVLAIDVPRESEQTVKAVEHIFSLIKGTKSVITMKEKWVIGKFWQATSFEIVSIDGYIQFYVRTNVNYRDMIEAAIFAQYPAAEITEVEDYTKNLPDNFPNDTHEVFGGELKFGKADYFPIRTWMEFEHTITKDQVFKDPLINLYEFMGKLKQGEQFWVHIMVNPGDAEGPYDKGQEWILKTYGKDLPVQPGRFDKITKPVAWFPKETARQLAGILGTTEGGDDKPMFKFFTATDTQKSQLMGVSMKLSKEGYYTKIRWGYVARHEVYNKGGRNTLWKSYISLFTHYNWNKFKYDPKTMPRDDYFYMRWEYRKKQRNLMNALKSRSFGVGSTPMYLNIEELATLWHFPSVDVQAPLIKKTMYKLGEAPTSLPEASFGETDDLPSEPLVEVDEQGRPIARMVEKQSESPERAPGPYDDDGVKGIIGGFDDILPMEEMLEEGEEFIEEEIDDDELDQPFIPPDLPV
jgi:hypothetical protein